MGTLDDEFSQGLRQKTILIVEDDRALHSAFLRIFQRHGQVYQRPMHVIIAACVDEAEQVLQGDHILAGAILDASLSLQKQLGADGEERPDLEVLAFLKRLRAKYPMIPVVASSSSVSCNDRLLSEGCTVAARRKEQAPNILLELFFPPVP
jgi:CheY-like chemotaxis protein